MNPWKREDAESIGLVLLTIYAAIAGVIILLSEIAAGFGLEIRIPIGELKIRWAGLLIYLTAAAGTIGASVLVFQGFKREVFHGSTLRIVSNILLFTCFVFPLASFAYSVGVGLFIGAPVLGVLVALDFLTASPDPVYLRRVVADLFILFSIPMILVSLSAIARMAWQWRIAAQLRSIPRSKVRAIPVGPVELHGVAVPARGPNRRPLATGPPLVSRTARAESGSSPLSAT